MCQLDRLARRLVDAGTSSVIDRGVVVAASRGRSGLPLAQAWLASVAILLAASVSAQTPRALDTDEPAGSAEVGPPTDPQASFATRIVTAEMNVTPQRCVTLREGQPCFTRLTLSWQLAEPDNVCLFVGGDNIDEPLACWTDSDQDVLKISQRLLKSTLYVLRNGRGESVAEANLTVAWVYKSRRSRRRWRLF